MNHKRRRHKTARAGCLLCKMHKRGGAKHLWLAHRGFGKLRREAAAAAELLLR
ncbi:MAG: hypothetical protein U1F67_23790 [Rubrivivax sp.]